MENKKQNTSAGAGFCSLLTLLFIGLKLTGHIEWSWLWVLSPMWIPPVAVIGIIAVVSVFLLLVGFLARS